MKIKLSVILASDGFMQTWCIQNECFRVYVCLFVCL